jgi:lipoyl-dependent peroxiredoxin subunit D
MLFKVMSYALVIGKKVKIPLKFKAVSCKASSFRGGAFLLKKREFIMSSLEAFRDSLGDFAKDVRVNLSSIMTPEGAADLTQEQIDLIALSSAYATRCLKLIDAVQAEVSVRLSEGQITAAKIASTMMAMNNVYYRFTHLVSDESVTKLPTKLRMMSLSSHGIPKVDFELCSLAVSAINGCGMCMESHVHEVLKHGITPVGVQSSIRIAAVMSSAGQAAML